MIEIILHFLTHIFIPIFVSIGAAEIHLRYREFLVHKQKNLENTNHHTQFDSRLLDPLEVEKEE